MVDLLPSPFPRISGQKLLAHKLPLVPAQAHLRPRDLLSKRHRQESTPRENESGHALTSLNPPDGDTAVGVPEGR